METEHCCKTIVWKDCLSTFQNNPAVLWLSIFTEVDFKIFMAFLPTLGMKLRSSLFSTPYYSLYNSVCQKCSI